MAENVQVEGKESARAQRHYIPKTLVNACKKDYLEGKGSIREISIKYEVSEKALANRCTREGWRATTEEIVEKAVEKIEKAEVSRLERLYAHEERMLKRMEERLVSVDSTIDQTGGLIEPSDLRSIVSTESTIDQVIRRNLGANEEKPQSQGGIVVNIVATLEKVWGEVQGGKARVWDVEAVKLAAQKLED